MDELYTERQALKDYIADLKEQRRTINDEYWKAINRLKELDSDTNNQSNTETTNKLIDVINQQKGVVERLGALIPKISPHDVLNFYSGMINSEVAVTSETISTSEIERTKDQDESVKPLKRRKSLDYNMLSQVVVSILKDAGRPVKAKDLFDELKKQGYKIINPTNTMNRLMQINIKIERVYRGIYQYKM